MATAPGRLLAVVRRFRVFIVMMLVFLASSAQLVNLIPDAVLYLVIGLPIVAFALFQPGWRLRLNPSTGCATNWRWAACGVRRRPVGGSGAAAGGLPGGGRGAKARGGARPWRDLRDRRGGVGLRPSALGCALNSATPPLSAAAMVPALAGLWAGGLLHARMLQSTFRRAMLVVLVLAGLNLMRRGARYGGAAARQETPRTKGPRRFVRSGSAAVRRPCRA
ncbi:MAG: hypothetical protein R3D59_17335 [Paracoccaceae bacterium]